MPPEKPTNIASEDEESIVRDRAWKMLRGRRCTCCRRTPPLKVAGSVQDGGLDCLFFIRLGSDVYVALPDRWNGEDSYFYRVHCSLSYCVSPLSAYSSPWLPGYRFGHRRGDSARSSAHRLARHSISEAPRQEGLTQSSRKVAFSESSVVVSDNAVLRASHVSGLDCAMDDLRSHGNQNQTE